MILPLLLLLSLGVLLFGGGCWAQIVDSGEDADDEEDGNWLRCKPEKELICHHTSGANDLAKTFEICVSPKSVAFHLQHGDTSGPCPPKIIACPETCDLKCPTACQDLIESHDICEDGLNCWDLNGNSVCDLDMAEDKNMDGVCDVMDCQGPSGSDGINGIDCWDLNQNHQCDLDTEDTNGDRTCSTLDCQVTSIVVVENGGDGIPCLENVKICCYIAIEGTVPPSSGFPMLGEIIWPAWDNCLQPLGTVGTPNFLPCLGQFVHNPALCALVGDRYGSGNSTDCSLPDFSGMKTAQYAL